MVTVAAEIFEELCARRHEGQPVVVDAATLRARLWEVPVSRRLHAGLTPRQLRHWTETNCDLAVARLLVLTEAERYARVNPKFRDARRFLGRPGITRFLTDAELAACGVAP